MSENEAKEVKEMLYERFYRLNLGLVYAAIDKFGLLLVLAIAFCYWIDVMNFISCCTVYLFGLFAVHKYFFSLRRGGEFQPTLMVFAQKLLQNIKKNL